MTLGSNQKHQSNSETGRDPFRSETERETTFLLNEKEYLLKGFFQGFSDNNHVSRYEYGALVEF